LYVTHDVIAVDPAPVLDDDSVLSVTCPLYIWIDDDTVPHIFVLPSLDAHFSSVVVQVISKDDDDKDDDSVFVFDDDSGRRLQSHVTLLFSVDSSCVQKEFFLLLVLVSN
jgi:hypothetical protein